MGEVQKYANPEAIVFLVGTHKDRPDRQVSKIEAAEKARALGVPYFEISNLNCDEPLRVLRDMGRACGRLPLLFQNTMLHEEAASTGQDDTK